MYVLEGPPPELKAQVMKKRQEARFGTQTQSNSKAKETEANKPPSRSSYKHVQKECVELLNALGVVSIESQGEAEAACAGLNWQGAVDGCITVDGDSFLYGAKTVFRHLSTDTSNFVCQEYSMDLIETRLNLSRDKLMVLAILLGCDYLPDGVPGVGRDSALRVLSTWKNGQSCQIIKSWIAEGESRIMAVPLRPPHCSQCKHPGSLRNHAKSGCSLCGGHSGCRTSDEACNCEWHQNEVRYEEYAIRTKLLRMEGLDVVEAIFDEFTNDVHMQHKGSPIRSWQMPSVKLFVQLATKKLKWETSYAIEKVLPLLSRWIVIHGAGLDDLPATPLRVNPKKRVKRGCPYYEVHWKLVHDIPECPAEFQTLEPQFLVEKELHSLLPLPVPKPLKKPGRQKKNKVIPSKKTSAPEAEPVDVMTMFQRMRLQPTATKSKPACAETSLLELTAATDDEADISAIVDMICERKGKGHSSTTSKEAVSCVEESSSNALKPIENIAHPLPNFSLNFSLGNLDSTTGTSMLLNEPVSPLLEATSTPMKKLPINLLRGQEEDSFSTPPSLADRFTRLRLQ